MSSSPIFSGSYGTSIFGDLVYPLLAPYVGGTLLEQYLDFHLGGIDDDAAWTGFMWNRFADWVSNGPPDTPPNRRLTEVGNEVRAKSRTSKKNAVSAVRNVLTKHEILPLKVNAKKFFDVTSNGRSSFIGNEKDASADVALILDLTNAIIDSVIVPFFSSVEKPEQRASFQMIDELRRNINARVRGADVSDDKSSLPMTLRQSVTTPEVPSNGTSCSKSPARTVQTEISVAQAALGSAPHEYLGSSVTVSDFTGGGKACDLLVGSYGKGRTDGPQEGSASIIFGAACDPKNPKGTVTFRGGVLGGQEDSPPSYERFGFASAAFDVNADGFMDALICAPSFGGRNVSAVVGNYSGRCDIFLGPFQAASQPQEAVLIPKYQIFGDKVWGQFGFAVTVGDIDSDGVSDLIISAPSAGNYPDISPNEQGDLSSQGAVYVYLGRSMKRSIVNNASPTGMLASQTADVTLQPKGAYQWYGRSLLVTQAASPRQYYYQNDDADGFTTPATAPLLIVGAPIYHPDVEALSAHFSAADVNSAVGRVYAYSFASRRSFPSAEEYSWSLTGCAHGARTGQSMAFSQPLNAIAVSEPAFNSSRARLKREKTAGKMMCEDLSVESEKDSYVVGYSRTPDAFFGQRGLRAGRVAVIPLDEMQRLSVTKSKDIMLCEITRSFDVAEGASFRDKIAVTVSGHDMDGRFGSAIAFGSAASVASSSEMQLHDRLIVGAPLAGDGSGAVYGFNVSFEPYRDRNIEVTVDNNVRRIARADWVIQGSDFGEKKSRFGSTILPIFDSSSAQSLLVGAPLADAGYAAPDDDQRGILISLDITYV